jgi:polysaccharide export outer membrane protein
MRIPCALQLCPRAAGRGLTRRSTLRLLMCGAAVTALAGCQTLPRSGPLASDILGDETGDNLSGLVADLDAATVARIAQPAREDFPGAFLTAAEIEASRLGVGDVLDLLIWEPGGLGLFAVGESMGRLPGVRVEPDGALFVPFAGRVQASGATPSELRDRIRKALEPYTSEPQVDLRLMEARSRTLTIQGAVARPGAYVIERESARLLPMLALAGGATSAPERSEIFIRRDGVTGSSTLDAVYADPRLNVALRPGDLLVIQPLRERFIALGASSAQAEVPFPTRPLSLLAALGAVGGLRDNDADPAGVFLFRREDRALADALLSGPEPAGLPPGPGRPVVYRLDLTGPEALFTAQRFLMRDGDAIFVTNAPLTELRKILQLFTAAIVPVQASTTLAP